MLGQVTAEQMVGGQMGLERGIEELREKYAKKAIVDAKEKAAKDCAQCTTDALAARAAAAEEARNPTVDMTMDDPEMEAMRQARLAALKGKAAATKRHVQDGGGELREIVEDEFLKEVTGHKFVVIHFYHPEFMKCRVMDKHLTAIAPRALGARFLKIDATKAPFFTGKLMVRVLPTLVFLIDGMAVGRQTGFDGLVSSVTDEDFPTSRLMRVIKAAGVLGEAAKKEAREDDGDGEDDDDEGGAAGGGTEGDFAARLARARRAMLEAALDDE